MSEADLDPDSEASGSAGGVSVERRSFLGVCTAAVLAPGHAALPGRIEDDPHVSLEEFLEDVLPVARALKQELDARPLRSLEDRYLHTLAAHAVRLADVPLPELRPTPQGEGVEIGASWFGDPFVVLHWRMAPGSRIRTHAHTYGNVCTLGLEGRARVRNYETLEALEVTAEDVRVRLTMDQVLEPGAVNLVPLSHGFCHGFEAGPEGARGLDITTRLSERKPTPYLVLGEGTADQVGRTYAARWELE